MEHHIEITGCSLVKVAQAAYKLSKPQGLGFLHFKESDLSKEHAESLIIDGNSHVPLCMDYVNGRAVKLVVFNKEGKLYIRDKWFDHSDQDLLDLLDAIKA